MDLDLLLCLAASASVGCLIADVLIWLWEGKRPRRPVEDRKEDR